MISEKKKEIRQIRIRGRQIRSAALTFLYPRRCPVCDGILLPKERQICKKCAGELRPILSQSCRKCGKPLPDREQEYCRDCLRVHHFYEKGFAAFSYSGSMQGSLLRFKQEGRREYADFYARMLLLCGSELWEQDPPQVLIPIPADPRRKRRRGYDQSEVLAISLSELTGIPTDLSALGRHPKIGRAQKLLNHMERRKNLLRAFYVCRQLPYQDVMLVDDIYTTGSTIDAAALILLRHGVKRIRFCTVAIGRNHE